LASSDDSGAQEAQPSEAEEPAPPEATGPSGPLLERGPRPLRYLFYGVWIFALPAAMAIAAVRLLKPEPYEVTTSVVRNFVGEQQVPATIMFFTLFAWILWRVRYVLPLATAAGVLGRRDLSPRLGAKFDDAAHLVVEARRIMSARKHEVQRSLGKREREVIEKSLDQLEEQMRAERMDDQRFRSALAKAEQLVSQHLGRWRKGELREYVESIGVAVAVALVLRFFVIEAFKIPSGSMIPTLMIGDHIFVAKYAYGPLLPRSDTRLYERLPPARGDVMVFKFPENKEQDFIKRVIALPGDSLEAIDGRPVINGWLAPHCAVGAIDLPHGLKGHLYLEHLGESTYLTMFDEAVDQPGCEADRDCSGNHACRGGVCGAVQGPYEVASEEVWVMGDNRNNSHDSRSWKGGMGSGVPFQNIKGRAMFVWWSWDPRGGVALDRLFVNVMGPPKLPPSTPREIVAGLQKCLRERPPVDQTTPPPAPRR
jgi:signal peptidase I